MKEETNCNRRHSQDDADGFGGGRTGKPSFITVQEPILAALSLSGGL
jgi:hypothetical protein